MLDFRCHLYLMLDDDVPTFSPSSNFYHEQIDREMTVNVLKKGKWGSYYKIPIQKKTHEEVDQLVTLVNHPTDVDFKFIGLNPVVKELGKEVSFTVAYMHIDGESPQPRILETPIFQES